MLKVVVVMEIIGEKRVDVQNILFSLSGIKRVQNCFAILCLFVIEAQLAFQICLHVDLMVEYRGLEKNWGHEVSLLKLGSTPSEVIKVSTSDNLSVCVENLKLLKFVKQLFR